MTTKTQASPNFLDRFKEALNRDAKAPRQYSVLDQTGDVLSDTARRLFLIFGILIISAAIAAFMPYILGSANGPADVIATIYAEVCISSGICDLPTLNTGFAIANIVLCGFILAVFAALRPDRNYGIYERFEDVLDILDRLETYTADNEELPTKFHKPFNDDDPELTARLETLAQGD